MNIIGAAVCGVFALISIGISGAITYFGAYKPFFSEKPSADAACLLAIIFGVLGYLIFIVILPVNLFTGERKDSN